ncbi:MAG: hypothetical protein ACXADY_24515, partial [Candidatus Hodarchaeales archaeon]
VECSNCGFSFDKKTVGAYQESPISATPTQPRLIQLTPTSPIICPECRFANKVTNVECSNCGSIFPLKKPTKSILATQSESERKWRLSSSKQKPWWDQYSDGLLAIGFILLVIITTYPFLIIYIIIIASVVGAIYVQYEFKKSEPLRSEESPIICPECRFASKSTSAKCSNCGFIFQVEEPIEPITTPPPTEFLSEEKKSLFSSLYYRVQDLIFEGPIIRLIPYTGSIQEITVEFKQNQIIMRGCFKYQTNSIVNLKIRTNKKLLPPSNDDCWQNITLTGDETVINIIKQHSEIAERIASIGTVFIGVESQTTGVVSIRIICNENKEALTQTYSLITELQSFIEEL